MRQTTDAPAPNTKQIQQAAGQIVSLGILLMVGGIAVICGCLAVALLTG